MQQGGKLHLPVLSWHRQGPILKRRGRSCKRRGQPVRIVAGCFTCTIVIGCTEGLQRVFYAQLFTELCAWIGCRAHVAVQIVAQFADYDRWRQFGAVSLAATHPGKQQVFTGREDGLQKKIPIIVAAVMAYLISKGFNPLPLKL